MNGYHYQEAFDYIVDSLGADSEAGMEISIVKQALAELDALKEQARAAAEKG